MNIYECCFVDYLKYRNLHHYHIEEIEQVFSAEQVSSMKNFDLIVPGDEANILIEIKGRKANGKNKMRFENWVTGDDIQSLIHWKERFGESFNSIFCFIYKIEHDMPPANRDLTAFTFNNLRFGFLGIELEKYIAESKLRSVKWNTFSLSSKIFSKYAKPIEQFLPASNSELELRDIEATFRR